MYSTFSLDMDTVQRLPPHVMAAAIAGLTVFIAVAYKVLAAIFCFLNRALCKRRISSYGKWAVVTGATDGIGKAYAIELAKRGLNIVLISRNPTKLEDTAKEVKSVCPNVETKTVTADFSEPATSGLYDRIEQDLHDLDIGVLINNVGCSYPSALYFHELDDIEQTQTLVEDMIQLNVTSTTYMTRIVLPGMVKRRRGAIVNISSAAGRIPIGNPMYAEYSASKAYVDYLARSLHTEVKQFGVQVQCQVPYFITTKLSKLKRPSLFTPTPKVWAKAAVNSIGAGDVVLPYWPHQLQDFVLQSLPTWALRSMLMSMHSGLRRRYLKKLKQQ